MSGVPPPKRKVRLGSIDPDTEQFALVVNYTTEIHHVDEFGQQAGTESQPGQKTIRLPRGLASLNIPALAEEVQHKCKYIPASKVGDVERLLYLLSDFEVQQQQHQAFQQQAPHHHQAFQQQAPHHHQAPLQGPPPGYHPGHQADMRQMQQAPPQREPPPPQHPQAAAPARQARPAPAARQEPLLPPEANMAHIDEYLDQLYEDSMELKVHGAKCILRVCTDAKHLMDLAEHDTLLGVLSRELRECFKKSHELCTVIVCTFLCFSHFKQFHPVLMRNQCGDVTLRVIQYESQRHHIRKEDIDKKIRRVQDLGEMGTSEDRKQLVKDESKYKKQLNNQSKLMQVCVLVLMNFAQDWAVEKKIVNRKLPLLLIQLLERTQEDLLYVALQFLKKLSIFEENKDLINTPDTLSRLVALSSHQNMGIASMALRTLYNMSFDESVRASLVESMFLKILVDHLQKPPFRQIAIRLLYHFSMDDRCKSLMAYYQDGMTMLLQLVVHFPEQRVGKDLVALVVNLATHPRCAEFMVTSGYFPSVMLRELKTNDPMLCKVIRHISAHKGVAETMVDLLQSDDVRMSRWMTEFVRMSLHFVENSDLLVEVLGTLANLTQPDIPWAELCEAGLIDLLHRLLVAGFSEDDIVLECVMLIGNMALCREAAQHVAESRLPTMLQDLLVEKREDEEIILQLLYTIECLFVHDESRDVVLNATEMVPCIMRYATMRSRNPAVVNQASITLQVAAEYVGEMAASNPEVSSAMGLGQGGKPAWAEQIKALRFEQHNAAWHQYVIREHSGGAGMSPYHYDEEQDSGEDEEEFAFHWEGGACADAGDLANRDWSHNNKDFGGFSSSRYVT